MQATVKHRMVYSSSKLGLLDSIKAELGIVIDGKVCLSLVVDFMLT